MVLGSGQGPLCWAFQCLLQIAGTSDVDRWLLAQPTRTAVYGPVRTVVWQGSAGDRRPYADQTPLSSFIPEWSLALIGNASGADCGGGGGSRSEAFSIRRLGGSRWRLRRTRCAMGFQRQSGSEQSLGRAVRRGGNAIGMVGVAAEMSKSACGKLLERQWRRSGHTRASACRSTSSGR